MRGSPHPGLVIKNHYLTQLKLQVTDVAKGLGVSRKTLSSIINGKAGISTEMAVRLSKAFGTTVFFWLNLQADYDLKKIKKSKIKVKILYRGYLRHSTNKTRG